MKVHMKYTRGLTRYTSRSIGVAAAVIALAGCSLSKLVDTQGDPGTIDPSAMKTEDAALLLYNGAIQPLRIGFAGQGAGSYVTVSGWFTDELTTGEYASQSNPPASCVDCLTEIDSRNIPEDHNLRSGTVEGWYRNLNLARNQAVDAIYSLRNYAKDQPSDLVGHMFAIRGLVLIYLADIFCSGIPLTDYESPGGYIYEPGSTTQDVYTQAAAQFDSALALTPDSLNFHYLAQVGKARALLNLGEFAAASAAVQGVPTNFQYLALYGNGGFSPNYAGFINQYSAPESYFGTLGNNEGSVGLPFVSAHDPRVPTIPAPAQNSSYPATQYVLPAWMFPTGSPWFGTSTAPIGTQSIVIANGIEARLIEAEAQVNAGDAGFLTTLNTLRTTGSFTTQPDPNNSAVTDTIWSPGTGGVTGLRPLTDPGDKISRVKLLYSERAFWLFLTGHRQGDLRRLVRVYQLPQNQVYPTGSYPVGALKAYGTDTNIPIPYTEQEINSKYKGCFNRDA